MKVDITSDLLEIRTRFEKETDTIIRKVQILTATSLIKARDVNYLLDEIGETHKRMNQDIQNAVKKYINSKI